MSNYLKITALALVLATSMFPLPSAAAKQRLRYGAWMPFWKEVGAVQDITSHLQSLQEVSPFSYEVKPDGTLIDKLKVENSFWPSWLPAVHDLHIRIIPTVAWFDTDTIYSILSHRKSRNAHIANIVALVRTNNFDGIDIDYEGKTAATKPFFSLFIKGLAQKLHARGKLLTCSVQPRTPPSSLYKEIPKDIKYSTDYIVLNRYCDEVRVLAYDQGRVDLLLDQTKGTQGALYAPVADPDWVKKVLRETLRYVNRRKVMLGIPAYGYDYLIDNDNGTTTYQELYAVTYKDAAAFAQSLGVTPQRNSAGELSFTFSTSTSVNTPLPAATSSSLLAPSSALSTPDQATSIRLVWFSDANAMADKITLAKKYGLLGVMIFSIDGNADPHIWEKLK